MLIKLSKELDAKIIYISKSSKMKKQDIIEKIFAGFINRYEAKNGKIVPKVEKGQPNDVWLMFEVFKKHYHLIYGQEYIVDKKEQLKQLRHIKGTKEKILQAIMNQDKTDIVSVDSESMVNAYEHILIKMPQWWKEHGLTPRSIYTNFDKIINQIQHGKQSRKDALDDLIRGFGG